MTSPLTPLISTQSPWRIPFFPINTNQPKNPTIKSFIATVSPAPASARTVAIWLGMPKTTSRIRMAPTARVAICATGAQGEQFLLIGFQAGENSLQQRSSRSGRPARSAASKQRK